MTEGSESVREKSHQAPMAHLETDVIPTGRGKPIPAGRQTSAKTHAQKTATMRPLMSAHSGCGTVLTEDV